MPKKLSYAEKQMRKLKKMVHSLERRVKREHRGRPVGSKNKPKKRGRGRPRKR
jgi:hypothetical protein